jgi:MoaA/NifB/PqqE/SkfB family radical SAM enzyme
MEAAQRLGLQTSFLSNGYRVPALIGQLGSQFRRLTVVQISLDGLDSRLHDARRGKVGAWRQAIAAIRALRCAQIPCEVSCTVSEENIPEVARLARFCRRLGIKLILRRLANVGRGKNVSLRPVSREAMKQLQDDLETRMPGVVVCDRFQYVPDGLSHDAQARIAGIATILPNGHFRGGPIFFPVHRREFHSITEMIAA